MSMSEHAKKYRDPRWQKKRLEILERDKWRCQKCDDDSSSLHVHHRVYVWGSNPWEHQDHWMVTLCEKCHEEEKDARGDNRSWLVEAVCGVLLAHEVGLVAGALDAFFYATRPEMTDEAADALAYHIHRLKPDDVIAARRKTRG